MKSCGAKGDGIQDDSQYLNITIAKALAQSEDLYIPSGTYKCDQFNSKYNKILRMDQPGVKKIRIYGETGTKITTSQPLGCILYIYDKNIDVIIENIFFENTHGITQNQTNAIQLLGTNQNAIQDFTIQNCRFEGFSTAISAQGVKGFIVQNNVFASPKGHDNAQDNSQPAVYIWLADNANGQCFNVKILNNEANGYTGNDITKTTTKRPMDGLIIAIAYGIQIKGNTTRNFSEEHMVLQPKITFVNSKDSALITENQFYESIPSGAMKKSAPLDANYGLRVECNNLIILNNNFFDYTLGILMRPFEFPNLNQHTIIISGNKFYSPNSKRYHVREAIKIQGNSEHMASDIVISNNIMTFAGIQIKSNRSAISLYDCKNVLLENNNITGTNIDYNGYSFSGILTKDCINLVNQNNKIKLE
ncbi:MAG TPA: hypothetical protein VNW06_06635 [Cytophagaceae bacterium]|nr:hypothetical protein [Cytophagaceae bacterium]